MKNSVFISSCILFCFLANTTTAQRLGHRIYTPADGLAELETYTLVRDEEGNLCSFGASHLSIFNGYQVKVFNYSDFGMHTYPMDVINTKGDELLILSNTGKVFFKPIHSDSIHRVDIESMLESLGRLVLFQGAPYLLDIRHLKYYGFAPSTRKFVRDTIPFVQSFLDTYQDSIETYYFNDDFLMAYFKPNNLSKKQHFINSKLHFTSDWDTKFLFPFKNEILTFNKGTKSFSKITADGEEQIKVPESISKLLGGDIQFINQPSLKMMTFLDSNSPEYNELVLIDSTLKMILLGRVPQFKYMRDIYSFGGKIWNGTFMGLFKYDPNILYFPSDDPEMPNAISALSGDQNGQLIFSGYHGQISIFNGDKLETISHGKYRILPGSISLGEKGNLFFCENIKCALLIRNSQITEIPFFENGQNYQYTGYYIYKLDSGQFAFGLYFYGLGIGEIMPDNTIQVHTVNENKGMHLGNVLTITEDTKGRIWAGRTSKGVSVYDPGADTAYTYFLDPNDPLSFGAGSSCMDEKENLWFGANDGLYLFEKPYDFDPAKDDFFRQTRKISLPNGDNTSVPLVKQIDNYLVFGNQSAISFIPLDRWYQNEETTPIYQLYYGEDIEGGGAEQNTILQDSKGYLWIGSQEGASRIDIRNYVFDTTRNEIGIFSVTNGNGKLELMEGNLLKIPEDNRNFVIHFGPKNNFSLLKNIFFDYVLTNGNGDTLLFEKYDQKGMLEMKYLPPGKYILEISAKKYGLLMDVKRINIIAPYGWFENPWSKAAAVLVLMSGLIFFFFYRARQQRKILESQLKLAQMQQKNNQLQLQSIISSFNPHFINNSLHWAQSRYRQDDELVKVIGRLSENIRFIFNSTRSGKAYHSLVEEIRLVENYVAIQLIRFSYTFDFRGLSLEIRQRLASFQLPILQLQIHVENAIEHGLRNRLESSFVELGITEEPEYVLFTITDDGCGREEAARMESSGTQTGTKMLKELHEMFNQNQSNTFKIKSWYEDGIFEDETGRKFGTRIHIRIPKTFTYEL